MVFSENCYIGENLFEESKNEFKMILIAVRLITVWWIFWLVIWGFHSFYLSVSYICKFSYLLYLGKDAKTTDRESV